jgi:hypothetical protein
MYGIGGCTAGGCTAGGCTAGGTVDDDGSGVHTVALHPAEVEWLEMRYPGDLPFPERIRLGRRRIQKRRALSGLAVGFLVVVVFGAQLESPSLQQHLDNRPGWLYALGTVLLIAGLVTMGLGLWRGARAGRLEAKRDSPLWALPWAERRAVYARVRGWASADDEDLLFLRAVALSLADQTYVAAVCGGLSIATLGPLLAEQTTVARMLLGAMAVVGLGVVAMMALLNARAGRRFAAAHPVVEHSAPAPWGRAVPPEGEPSH